MAQPHRVGAHPVDQHLRRRRLEPEAELLGVGDQHPRYLARFRRRELVHLAVSGLDRFQQPARRLVAGDQDQGQVRRQRDQRGGDGLVLAIAPALDAVGEQVAPLAHQRHRGDRGQQRLVIRHPPALAGLEDLQRRVAALAFGPGAQAGAGGIDLGAVGAGDQVQGAHLGHRASLDARTARAGLTAAYR